METQSLLRLLFFVLTTFNCTYATGQTSEYCIRQTFTATCGIDEVILIEHAQYGRMRIGKCIKDDYGFGTIGCSANVTETMQNKCSGTRLCEVPVVQFEVDLPCLKGTNAYLEASYNCKEVFTPNKKRCTSPLTIPVTTRPQYLSSLVSKDTSCGLQQTPYSLEAKPGQKVTVTVESFTVTQPAGEENSKQCPVNLGYLLDTETDDVTSLCGGRSGLSIQSVGNKVQVLLERSAVSNHNFLVKFEAKGCPEVVPPKYSWMKRQNNTVTLGCQSSTERWSLRCVGNIWLGIMKKCPPPPVSEAIVPLHASKTPETEDDDDIVITSDRLPNITSNHLFAVAIACVTIIICVTTVVLGIHCVKRYELSVEKKTNMGLVTLPTGSLYRSLPVTNNTNTMVPAYTFDRPGVTVGSDTVNQRPESDIYNSLDRQPQLLT